MLNKLKKNDKKGFTLVELIVVLVILAILAALLVPALTGYIDKAKNKAIVAETRQVVMAAQSLVDEYYAKQDVGATVTVAADGNVKFQDVADLAEVKVANIKTITVGKVESGKTTDPGVVTTVVYTNKGKTCTYTKGETSGTDGAYNVTATTP